MAAYTQANRPMRVDTGLGEDVLLLSAFNGHEGMSQLFGFQLDLHSIDADIDPAALPPLAITVEDLRIADAPLGRMELRTRPTANGLRLDSLRVHSASANKRSCCWSPFTSG